MERNSKRRDKKKKKKAGGRGRVDPSLPHFFAPPLLLPMLTITLRLTTRMLATGYRPTSRSNGGLRLETSSLEFLCRSQCTFTRVDEAKFSLPLKTFSLLNDPKEISPHSIHAFIAEG